MSQKTLEIMELVQNCNMLTHQIENLVRSNLRGFITNTELSEAIKGRQEKLNRYLDTLADLSAQDGD